MLVVGVMIDPSRYSMRCSAAHEARARVRGGESEVRFTTVLPANSAAHRLEDRQYGVVVDHADHDEVAGRNRFGGARGDDGTGHGEGVSLARRPVPDRRRVATSQEGAGRVPGPSAPDRTR